MLTFSSVSLRVCSCLLLCLTIACGAPQNEQSSSEESATDNSASGLKPSGALQSLEFLNAARSFPDAAPPPAAWYEAWQHSAKQPSDQLAADGESWEPIGPQNLGGRTLVLAINPLRPQTMYAGSAGGGLWRSYTGGEGATAWHRIETGFPVLAVAAVAIDPQDTSTIYIGTGEVYNNELTSGGLINRTTRGSYGIGILKSTDGGASWQPALDWTRESQRAVQAVRIDPQNSNTVLAGTTEGVLRSRDGGNSWSTVLDAPIITDLVIDPDDASLVFAAAGNFNEAGSGIYRSRDGGDNWTRLANDLPQGYVGKAMLAFRPGTPDEVWASIGSGFIGPSNSWILRSRDGGDSWEVFDENSNHTGIQAWYSHDVSPHPTRANEVVFAGVYPFRYSDGNVVKTGDWRSYIINRVTAPGEPSGTTGYCHADCHDIVRHPLDPDIVYYATDGGIFVSDAGGAPNSFRNLNGGYQVAQFYNGFSSSTQNPDFALGGLQDNFVVGYYGELGWARLLQGDGTWTAIHPSDDDIIFGSLQNLAVRYSTNSGGDWSGVPGPPSGARTAFIAPFVQLPTQPGAIFGGSNPPYIFDIAGVNIRALRRLNSPNDIPLSMDVSHQNAGRLYIASMPQLETSPLERAKVYRSDDGGASWILLSDDLPNRFPMDIQVDPYDDNIVYLAFGGFGNDNLYRSTDAGASWEDISAGLPAIPTFAVRVDPFNPDHMYVGNEFGVWFSDNLGLNWRELDLGAPEVMHVMDLSVSMVDRKIRAVTHGNGVFERTLVSEIPVSVTNKNIHGERAAISISPNPVSDRAVITLRMPRTAPVEIELFDLNGRPVMQIMPQTVLEAGKHEFELDMSSADVGSLAAGSLILNARIGSERLAKSILLVP